ncbi:hypothetical protein RJ55_02863 [Drechmeria coniospora]|nr:hypothetical protein RJ55_02863 [Drechmeria coniospora]
MPCSKSWRMREPNAGGASHRHGLFARPTATAYTDGGTGKHARQDWRRRRLAGLDNGSRSNSRPSPPPPARYGLKKSSQVKGDAGLIERFTAGAGFEPGKKPSAGRTQEAVEGKEGRMLPLGSGPSGESTMLSKCLVEQLRGPFLPSRPGTAQPSHGRRPSRAGCLAARRAALAATLAGNDPDLDALGEALGAPDAGNLHLLLLVCVRLGISGGRVAAQTFATLRTMASVFEETKAIAGSQLVEIMDTSERVA